MKALKGRSREDVFFGWDTWRIIPVSKWLVTPFISNLGDLEGEQSYLGDLLTMVINHLLTGMILQVSSQKCPNGPLSGDMLTF